MGLVGSCSHGRFCVLLAADPAGFHVLMDDMGKQRSRMTPRELEGQWSQSTHRAPAGSRLKDAASSQNRLLAGAECPDGQWGGRGRDRPEAHRVPRVHGGENRAASPGVNAGVGAVFHPDSPKSPVGDSVCKCCVTTKVGLSGKESLRCQAILS